MKKGGGWPIAMSVILGAVVVSNIWVMRVAGSDPSFVIEPDYYRRAVAWDSSMAQARENAALGWRVDAELGSVADDSTAVVRVRLTDASGAGVSGAAVRGTALFVGRASDVHEFTMEGGDVGEYTARITVKHAGVWEVSIAARRGADHFTRTLRVTAGREVEE